MQYVAKRLTFQLLVTTTLSLTTLSSLGAIKVIDLEFDDGRRATYGPRGLSFAEQPSQPSSSIWKGNCIQVNSLEFDPRRPLLDLLLELQQTPRVRNATLTETPSSPDDECGKECAQFWAEYAPLSSKQDPLSRQAIAELFRNYYFSLQYLQQQGSNLARTNLPNAQNNLALALSQFSSDWSPAEKIPLLRETVGLLTEAAASGHVLAKENFPIAQYTLGFTLAAASIDLPPAESIPLLREVLGLFTKAAELGHVSAKNNLPIAQCNLGFTLESSSINLPSAKSIPLLREVLCLFTKADALGHVLAKEKFLMAQNNLGVALADSSINLPSAERIPFFKGGC